MLWLALHFPQLGLEIFNEPEAATDTKETDAKEADTEEPTVLVENNKIILRNTAAQEANIGLGSTLATAHSIVANVIHFNRSQEQEGQRLHLLAQTLYRFSSEVVVQTPDTVLLEIDRSLKLFGTPSLLQKQVRKLCQSLGHIVQIHQHPVPLAAALLAQSQKESQKESQKQSIAQIPLAATHIDSKQIERLANMGIYHLGALLELPYDELGQRFGKALPDYLDRITGQKADPQINIKPAAEFDYQLHMLEALNSKQTLLIPMQRLATQLQHWLSAQKLATEQLHWSFAPHQGQATKLRVKFSQPQQNKQAFLKISQLQIDGAELPADVLTIGLQATHLLPWREANQELFQLLPGAGFKENPEEINELVDEIIAHLGEDSCHCIESKDHHAPERAWALRQPELKKKSELKKAPKQSRYQDNNQPERPLWLFQIPIRTSIKQLKLLEGPERIQTNWWTNQFVYRDYYIAEHRNGAKCWAFTDTENQWYLHGYFA